MSSSVSYFVNINNASEMLPIETGNHKMDDPKLSLYKKRGKNTKDSRKRKSTFNHYSTENKEMTPPKTTKPN